MPLMPGNSPSTMSQNFDEVRRGPQFGRTASKFGKPDAMRQMQAIVLKNAAKTGKKPMMKPKMGMAGKAPKMMDLTGGLDEQQ